MFSLENECLIGRPNILNKGCTKKKFSKGLPTSNVQKFNQ